MRQPASQDRARIVFDCRTTNDSVMISSQVATKDARKLDAKSAFLTAEAFLEVCKAILEERKRGNTRMLNLALATNAAFSLEIYLKCLLLLEEGDARRGHDIYKLFHELNSSTQSELTKAHDAFVRSKPSLVSEMRGKRLSTDLKELLKRGRNAFVNFRYTYEQVTPKSDFALNGLTYCIRERILKLRPEWKSALADVFTS
jgi:HEPN domain-containing protein